MKICIVGLGLIGGSFSLGLKEKLKDLYVLGVDNNPEHLEKAKELNIINEAVSFEKGIQEAPISVLATPVDVIAELLPKALDILPETSILTDFGSTKSHIAELVQAHPKRGQYVALHPIAGTENSGPEAAFAELMRNKIMIICDAPKSNAQALTLIELLCNVLEMEIYHLSSSEHDLHLAYVSHLSHVVSFALSTTVLEKEKDEHTLFELAGSGFASTARLAKSSPNMWRAIFKQNKENISEALVRYIQALQKFKDLLDTEDMEALAQFMQRANTIRRVLDQIN